MITVAIVKEVNETELVATWTPSDIAVKVGDWIGVENEWQGLSDDEIKQAILSKNKAGEWWGMCLDIARAIEQALKEKNHEHPF